MTALRAFSPIIQGSSEDEDALAVVDALVYLRLVGDEGADAAVARRIVRNRVVAVHGVAAVEVERVVHAVRVIAGFRPDEGEVAGDRRGRGLARRNGVDRERLVALGEDQHLLGERRLEVFAGTRMADLVFALSGEGSLHQPLPRTGAARHAVDFAIGEDAARGLAAEATAAVGDVAHPAHRLLEADHDLPALALAQRGEGDAPALADGRVAAQRPAGGQPGAGRVLARLLDPDLRPEAAAVDPDPLGLDPVSVDGEADHHPLARDEGLHRAGHRDRAHHPGLAVPQVADL